MLGLKNRPYIWNRYLQSIASNLWPLTMDPVVLSEFGFGGWFRGTPAPAPALGVAGVKVRPDTSEGSPRYPENLHV